MNVYNDVTINEGATLKFDDGSSVATLSYGGTVLNVGANVNLGSNMLTAQTVKANVFQVQNPSNPFYKGMILPDHLTDTRNFYLPDRVGGGVFAMREDLPLGENGVTLTAQIAGTLKLGGDIIEHTNLSDPTNTYSIHYTGLDIYISKYSDSSAPYLGFVRGDDSGGTYSTTLSNMYLGVIGAGGYSSGVLPDSASIIFQAAQDYDDPDHRGSRIHFSTTGYDDNQMYKRLSIKEDGYIRLPAYASTNVGTVSYALFVDSGGDVYQGDLSAYITFDSNFANTDLTFSGDRYHNADHYQFTIENSSNTYIHTIGSLELNDDYASFYLNQGRLEYYGHVNYDFHFGGDNTSGTNYAQGIGVFYWNGDPGAYTRLASDGVTSGRNVYFPDDSGTIALQGWVLGQGFLTGEVDTLDTVAARGATTSRSLRINKSSDVTTAFIINGLTKGIRFGTTTSGSTLEGVDNTGVTSWQPLTIGALNLAFHTNGTTRWLIDSSGHFVANTNNAYDIGASGTTVRNLYAGFGQFGSINFGNSAGTITQSGTILMLGAAATTSILVANGTTNGIPLIQLGGITTAFPAIKRNGVGVDFRLADNSAYTNITAGAGSLFYGNTFFYYNNSTAANPANGIVVKHNSIDTGGYPVMEISGTSATWTTGKGIKLYNHGTGSIAFGNDVLAEASFTANLGIFGTTNGFASNDQIRIGKWGSNLAIMTMKYASSPYPDLYLNAPNIRFYAAASGAWADGNSALYGSEKLAVTSVGVTVTGATSGGDYRSLKLTSLQASNNGGILLTATNGSTESPSIRLVASSGVSSSEQYVSGNRFYTKFWNTSGVSSQSVFMFTTDNRAAKFAVMPNETYLPDASIVSKAMYDGGSALVVTRFSSSQTANIFRVSNEDGTANYFNVGPGGAVGIGVATPAYTLDILGNFRLSNGLGGSIEYGYSSNNSSLAWNGNTSSNSGQVMSVGLVSGSWVVGTYTANDFNIRTNNTNRITINGTTGAAVFSSSVTATSFIKTSGTSSQFLKADGSVDTNSYSTTAHNHTLDSLSNVTITSKATGDLVKWNGSAWVNFVPTYISSFTDTNFATNDLSFTSDRYHDVNGYLLNINNAQDLSFTLNGSTGSLFISDTVGAYLSLSQGRIDLGGYIQTDVNFGGDNTSSTNYAGGTSVYFWNGNTASRMGLHYDNVSTYRDVQFPDADGTLALEEWVDTYYMSFPDGIQNQSSGIQIAQFHIDGPSSVANTFTATNLVVTGAASVIGGTIANRTLSINSATNSYISFDTSSVEKWVIGREATTGGDDQFIFYSDTTSGYRMKISDYGYVDITGGIGLLGASYQTNTGLNMAGTTGAQRLLHIGATGTNAYIGTASSSGGSLITGSGAYSMEFRNDTGFAFGLGATLAMTINSTGVLSTNSVTVDNGGSFPYTLGVASGVYRIDRAGGTNTPYRFLNSSNSHSGVEVGFLLANTQVDAVFYKTSGYNFAGTISAGATTNIYAGTTNFQVTTNTGAVSLLTLSSSGGHLITAGAITSGYNQPIIASGDREISLLPSLGLLRIKSLYNAVTPAGYVHGTQFVTAAGVAQGEYGMYGTNDTVNWWYIGPSYTTANAYFYGGGRTSFGGYDIAGQGQVAIKQSATMNNESEVGLSIQAALNDTKLVLGTVAGTHSYIQSLHNGNNWATRNLLLQPNGGNVTVGGTTSGSIEKLDVIGTIKSSSYIYAGSSATPGSGAVTYMFNNGTIGAIGTTFYSGGYTPLTFWTGGSERMRIDTTGLVGIGTTPAYRFDILDNSANGRGINVLQSATSGYVYGGYFAATGSGATRNTALSVEAYYGTQNTGLYIAVPSGSNNYSIYSNGSGRSWFGGNVEIHYAQFETYNTNDEQTFRIEDGGHIRILDGPSGNEMWSFDTDGGFFNRSPDSNDKLYSSSDGTFQVQSLDSSSNWQQRLYINAGDDIAYATFNNSRLGIGADATTDEMLYVDGNIRMGSNSTVSTSSPLYLNMGGTYSPTHGANPKLMLWFGGGSTFFGMGVSVAQLDYMAPTSAGHVFYSGTTVGGQITEDGIFSELTLSTTGVIRSGNPSNPIITQRFSGRMGLSSGCGWEEVYTFSSDGWAAVHMKYYTRFDDGSMRTGYLIILMDDNNNITWEDKSPSVQTSGSNPQWNIYQDGTTGGIRIEMYNDDCGDGEVAWSLEAFAR